VLDGRPERLPLSPDRKAGKWGHGVVYKAEDTRLNRIVALKLLPDEWGASGKDPERRRRLIQEAGAASSLDHPNVVTIYQVDEAEGSSWSELDRRAGGAPGRKSRERALRSAALKATG
jgi:serine/threonine-protein kinase